MQPVFRIGQPFHGSFVRVFFGQCQQMSLFFLMIDDDATIAKQKSGIGIGRRVSEICRVVRFHLIADVTHPSQCEFKGDVDAIT